MHICGASSQVYQLRGLQRVHSFSASFSGDGPRGALMFCLKQFLAAYICCASREIFIRPAAIVAVQNMYCLGHSRCGEQTKGHCFCIRTASVRGSLQLDNIRVVLLWATGSYRDCTVAYGCAASGTPPVAASASQNQKKQACRSVE